MRRLGVVLGYSVLWVLAAIGTFNYLTMADSASVAISVPIGLLVCMAVWVTWKRQSRAAGPRREQRKTVRA